MYPVTSAKIAHGRSNSMEGTSSDRGFHRTIASFIILIETASISNLAANTIFTMVPVFTSSSRRPGVQLPRSTDGSIGSFLAPPLYYDNKNALNRGGKQARVLLVTDKNGNRVDLPRSPSSFTPIKDEKPPASFDRFTPPMSPYYRSNFVASPSPTLMSATSSSETPNTSMVSPYCMSPSPIPVPSSPFTPCAYPASTSAYSSSGRYEPSQYSTPKSSRHGRWSIRSPENYVTPVRARSSPNKKMMSSASSSTGSLATPNSSSDDSSRKQRVKTELCMHHESGKVCPFGVHCTYAHGEEELQMTKLMDLHRAGLIEDIETYRSKPCLTWVATGSCPFGKRCSCIHDPRVVGANPSWLPHTETQGNSISTDINVDGLYQKRLHAILYGNPFGDQFSFELDDWADLYKIVCNVTSNIRRRRTSNLTELQKLSIVLRMRGQPGWMYKYRPQHIIYDTLCMVVQKRAFRIDKSGNVVPLDLTRLSSKNPNHILVREIAFGPDSDPSVRPVSLWFNIPESSVSECTPQQAKRFRWKKKPKGDDQQFHNKSNMFEMQDNFVMIRPEDCEAFQLATDILEHRYSTLKADGLSNMRDRSVALKKAEQEKQRLQEDFKGHRRHWLEWAWPINRGRHQTINEATPVPPVETEYTPIIGGDDDAMDITRVNTRGAVEGHFVERIWESFVSNRVEKVERDPQLKIEHRRLPIFARLGYGEPTYKDRTPPHIFNRVLPKQTDRLHSSRQSERCWKALMLKGDDDELKVSNEWEVVHEHFQNARSKKVLTIIQQ